ncbi:MAG: GntR family transcriptional regulator [Planctomycetota bacterium]
MSPRKAAPRPRRTVAEDVYQALKRDVLTLRHRPGEPLREQDLAERYGASRAPVREACRRLQQEGLVESVPYKGYFAQRISLKEIAECFDLRLVLETHAVRSAVERVRDGGAESVERLEALGRVEYTRDDPDSYEEFLARNLEFHVAVAELAGNGRLLRVLKDLIESMQRFFFLGLDLGDFGAEMREEHEELIRLIRDGDADGAADMTRRQIERSRERILKALFKERADLPVS